MKKITEQFDPERIQFIKDSLIQNQEEGKPKYYKILMDGMTIVEKTTDLDLFDSYESKLKENTQHVEIQVYTTSQTSNWHTKFVFELIPSELSSSGMSGTMPNEQNWQLHIQRLNMELDKRNEEMQRAYKKIKKLKKQNRYLESIIEKVEKAHLEGLNKKGLQMDDWSNIVAGGLEVALKRFIAGLNEDKKDKAKGKELSGEEAKNFKAKNNKDGKQKDTSNEHDLKGAKPKSLDDAFNLEEKKIIETLLYYFADNKQYLHSIKEAIQKKAEKDKNETMPPQGGT